MRLRYGVLAAFALAACFRMPDPAQSTCEGVECTDAGASSALDGASSQPPVSDVPIGDASVSEACLGFDATTAARLADSNGTFFATGVDRRTTFSTDGVHWTTNEYVAPEPDAAAQLGNIAATATANGTMVAAASIGIMTSSDGLVWTARAVPETRPYVHYDDGYGAAAYGKGVFVVAAGPQFNPVAMFHSTDGITWPTPTVVGPDDCCRNIGAIAFADDKFVAVGAGLRTVTSDDGIDWHDDAFASTDGSRVYYAVAFGNGHWVTVGNQSSVAWSADAKTWTAVDDVDLIGDFANLVWAGDHFLTCSRVGCYRSADGATWTQLPGGIDDPRPTRKIVLQGGVYVGIDAPATIMTSPDGSTWTPVYCGEAPALAALEFVPH